MSLDSVLVLERIQIRDELAQRRRRRPSLLLGDGRLLLPRLPGVVDGVLGQLQQRAQQEQGQVVVGPVFGVRMQGL